jgi:hypothetical protein
MSDKTRLLLLIVIATVVIELVTIVLRFGFALESTRHTASTIGVLTMGLRIHHGYCGALIVIVAWGLSQQYARIAKWGYVAGWALFLSDMIHHFAVLWPITGSPQFHLFYPG